MSFLTVATKPGEPFDPLSHGRFCQPGLNKRCPTAFHAVASIGVEVAVQCVITLVCEMMRKTKSIGSNGLMM